MRQALPSEAIEQVILERKRFDGNTFVPGHGMSVLHSRNSPFAARIQKRGLQIDPVNDHALFQRRLSKFVCLVCQCRLALGNGRGGPLRIVPGFYADRDSTHASIGKADFCIGREIEQQSADTYRLRFLHHLSCRRCLVTLRGCRARDKRWRQESCNCRCDVWSRTFFDFHFGFCTILQMW